MRATASLILPEDVLFDLLVAVAGLVTEFDLDLHEAVVLGDTVGPAEGTSLDLAAVGSDGDVGDGGVLSLTGAVGGNGGVAVV